MSSPLGGSSFNISKIQCPTRYRTRHFFNAFATNEDITTKFEADLPTHYRHIPFNFLHNELTAAKISLQYLHWCQNY
jgi:hypothetical protein